MKKILSITAAAAFLVAFSAPALANEIIEIKGEGDAMVEFDPSDCSSWGIFYSCSSGKSEKKAKEAKDKAYAQAIDDAKTDAIRRCEDRAERRGLFGTVRDNLAEKWRGTMGRCDRFANPGTGMAAMSCKATVKARCEMAEADPRVKDDSGMQAKKAPAAEPSVALAPASAALPANAAAAK